VRTIAAFDVDGTLTRRDTVLPFLATVSGWRAVAAALAADWRGVAHAAIANVGRDEAKATLVGATLEGVPFRDVEDAGERFADRVFARGMRADVVARLLRHQRRGHTIIVISAGLDVYVRPLADHLGIEHVFATRLEVGDDGRCTGRLDGPNVRGKEKVACLANFLGSNPATVWAYGNSSDDAHLLAEADTGILIGRTPISPDPEPEPMVLVDR
jgi:phosphatidylglycerophosphatase C